MICLKKLKKKEVTYPLINHTYNIHKAFIHKNVSLFYKEDTQHNKIYLITFFNNRMNPEILKELLNK